MPVFNNMLAGASGGAGAAGYAINRSLRFNSADSADLRRVHASGGSKSKFTISCWLKRCKSGEYSYLLGRDGSFGVYITNTDKLHIDLYAEDGSSWAVLCDSQAILRDFSAWYHIVVALDSSAGTANADRIKFWLNGVQQTFDFTVYWGGLITGNIDSFNDNASHSIGSSNGSYYGNIYLAEYYLIDGQALSASDFGEYDDNNVWQPKKFAGTYGTNGVKLNFSDTSSNSALGNDSSGAGNNWSVNNLVAADGNAAIYTNAVTTTEGGGVFYSSTVPANLFSASTLLYGGYNSSNGNSNIIWTPPGGIAVNNPKITLSYYSAVKINGTAYTPTGSGELTIPFVGTLNTLLLENTDGSHAVVRAYGLKPDGTNLVTLIDGANTDALRDSPVNGDSANDTGAGGEITGNYATWNPLAAQSSGSITLSNGNLTATVSSTRSSFFGTMPLQGKIYWEIVFTGGVYIFGMTDASMFNTTANTSPNTFVGLTSTSWSIGNDGSVYNNGVVQGTETSWTNGDVMGWSYDSSNGAIKIYKNGTLNGSYTASTANTYFPAGTLINSGSVDVNFGQRAFAYTAPSGYKALCAANLPDPTIADGSQYFDTKLWSGNGGTQSIAGYDFSPSFVWIKKRNNNPDEWHGLTDTVRGVTKTLYSNETHQESTETGGLTAFNADGFSVGNWQGNNHSSGTYVGWAWDAGDNSNKTYAVTVSNPGSGNKYYVDGAQQPTLTLAEGSTYKFDQSSGTNSTHPLRFSTTSDGTHGGGSEYTTGVTTSGTPGSAGAYTQIVIAASAPTLYAYCTNHSGMGFQVNTSDTAGYTIPVGGENSAVYDQSQDWSGGTVTGTPASAWSGAFDGAFGTGVYTYTTTTTTLTLSSSTTWSSKFEVYALKYGGSLFVNGVDVGASMTGFGTTVQWHDITSIVGTSGTLTSLGVSDVNTNYTKLFAVRLDGKILVDSGVTPPTSVPSIASTVRANPSAGFSIVKFTTGSGTSGGATVGHGLNAQPGMYIFKPTSTAGAWIVVHSFDYDQFAYLNDTTAFRSISSQGGGTPVDPTSSVVTLYDLGVALASKTYICLCFSPVESYSAFGSYEGNSSDDGPFVYTGFRPAFVLTKWADGSDQWQIHDTARSPENVANEILMPNTNLEEKTYVYSEIDILSNGFKIRNANQNVNASSTYVWAAFASNPFKTSRAR